MINCPNCNSENLVYWLKEYPKLKCLDCKINFYAKETPKYPKARALDYSWSRKGAQK